MMMDDLNMSTVERTKRQSAHHGFASVHRKAESVGPTRKKAIASKHLKPSQRAFVEICVPQANVNYLICPLTRNLDTEIVIIKTKGD